MIDGADGTTSMKQLLVRERAARVDREHAQEMPLDRREAKLLAVPHRYTPSEIDDQIADADRLRPRAIVELRAAEVGLHTGDELRRAEWLGDVIIGPGVQEPNG